MGWFKTRLQDEVQTGSDVRMFYIVFSIVHFG